MQQDGRQDDVGVGFGMELQKGRSNPVGKEGVDVVAAGLQIWACVLPDVVVELGESGEAAERRRVRKIAVNVTSELIRRWLLLESHVTHDTVPQVLASMWFFQ